MVGSIDGWREGSKLGSSEGSILGSRDGSMEGSRDGTVVGSNEGSAPKQAYKQNIYDIFLMMCHLGQEKDVKLDPWLGRLMGPMTDPN